MTDPLVDDPLTDEDVASAGAVPWAELPEPDRSQRPHACHSVE
jgi:hypothetical protein